MSGFERILVQPTIELGGMILDNLPKVEMHYGSDVSGFGTRTQRMTITLRHFDKDNTEKFSTDHTVTLELGYDGNWTLVTKI